LSKTVYEEQIGEDKIVIRTFEEKDSRGLARPEASQVAFPTQLRGFQKTQRERKRYPICC